MKNDLPMAEKCKVCVKKCKIYTRGTIQACPKFKRSKGEVEKR